jgi:glycosyltransferase involved in cell wall biosynthesis
LPTQPRIKILFCIDNLVRGGTELQLIGLIDRLDRRRFEPHLLTIRPTDPDLIPADCRHLSWDVPRLICPAGASALWRLRDFLRREGFQVVQTFFQDSTLLGGTAARLAGVPIRLASFRDLGFWRTRGQMLLLHRVYAMMTGFLANAEVVKRNFMEHDGLRGEAIRVIYNGIAVEDLPWVEHRGPTVNIGIVGNLTRHVKRTDLFLQAAGLVTRRTGRRDLRWHIIGDGHLRGALEEQAAREGLAGSVVFAGRISQVAEYLEQLDVGVLCSDSEGFSNALLEYMLKGCACVATAVGGNPEVIEHEKSGLLVPADDAEALADAMQRLIDDTDLRQRLAVAARRHCEAAYSWERCLREHAAVYDPAGRTEDDL